VTSRSHRALLTAAALAALVAPAAAAATNTQTLDFGVRLIRQPIGGPWEIALNVHATTAAADGSKPSELRSMRFLFPRATVNARRFPTCDRTRLLGGGTRACPRGSVLGSGTSLVDVRPVLSEPVHARISVVNGEPRAGNPVFLFRAEAVEVSVVLVLEGVLRRAGGRYGYRLDVPIPDIPTLPGQPNASIRDVNVTVGAAITRAGRRIPLLQAPRSCPAGGFPFQGSFGFVDGQALTVDAVIPCTLTSRPAGAA